MKKLFIVSILFFIHTMSSAETKADALLSLNKKIDINKRHDSEKNYNYLFEEVDLNEKKAIKFIQFCTEGELCSTAYYLTAKEYSEITVTQQTEYKYIQISFPKNSIETEKINIRTGEHFNGESTSSIAILLKLNTPQSEVNSIKIALAGLLDIYGIKHKIN